MIDLRPHLERVLDADALAFLDGAREALAEKGPNHLAVLFPQLSRRLGRHALGAARTRADGVDVDLTVWRACDAGGAWLVGAAGPSDDVRVDLFLHGDLEERTIALRTETLLAPTPGTVRLLGEVQRTNTGVHVEAGALDSDVVVRTLEADVGFTTEDFYRCVLKVAFLDLPIWRMFGALERADAPLSEMLLAYATEREAAARSVWLDTYRFIGRAPVEGARARLIGGIEHGSDPVRLAAAEGLRSLARPALKPFLEERLPREPRPEIRAILEATIAAASA